MHYKFIKPQFRELYKYAYAETSYRRNGESKKFQRYFEKLIDNKCYQEIKFIIVKRFLKHYYDFDLYKYALKKIDLKLLNVINNPSSLSYAFGDLLYDDMDVAFKLIKIGYRPDSYDILRQYNRYSLRPFCKNFEILKLIPPEEKLDDILPFLAHYHSELIEPFLSKFRHRITDVSPKPFKLHLSESEFQFLKTCEILGFRPEDFISDLFIEGMNHGMTYHTDDVRLADFCLKKYPQYVDVKKKHLKFALEEDNIDLALLLIKAGGNIYEINNWQSKCSEKMLKKISKC